MPLSAAAVEELSAEEVGGAGIVLLTIQHVDRQAPISVTSDGAPTIHDGYVYTPFPFEISLPDDVEKQAPIASLRIDNTNQQIIADLRGLESAPKVNIRVVRSADTNVIEREYDGLELRGASYDVGSITGKLTVEDWSTEEFPYETFDGRWVGLWKA